MQLPQEIIIKKREGKVLSRNDVEDFIEGMEFGAVSDAHIASFCMAVLLNGMKKAETSSLTKAMAESGTVIKWYLEGPVVDKHSTGGVGDKVSLMLAPMLAAVGAYVPMVSGRGLGHTGGTLDKLSSIPGYDVFPSISKFHKTVKDVGCAIIGQTNEMAPADRRIYAVRDVTGTVESLPLITSSILSKKIAAGIENLVIDLKVGNGAFMPDMKRARLLSKSLVSTAANLGLIAKAVITDMNQVLGKTVGNALEIKETVEYLTGDYRDERLHEVVMSLGAELMLMQYLARTRSSAYAKLEKALDSGKAFEKFAMMVYEQGGPGDFMKRYDKYLPQAKMIKPVYASKSGYVRSMDTRTIGLSLIHLGGGRIRAGDGINPAVGYSHFVQVGDSVERKTPLALVHADSQRDFDIAKKILQNSINIGFYKPNQNKVVYEVING